MARRTVPVTKLLSTVTCLVGLLFAGTGGSHAPEKISLSDGQHVITWEGKKSLVSDGPAGLDVTCYVKRAATGDNSTYTTNDRREFEENKQACLSHSRETRAVVRVTFPGTRWCGPGNTARNGNDLGMLRNTDRCCREHDGCPFSIGAFATKYGLHNKLPLTVSSCQCDRKFWTCLKSNRSFWSDVVGRLFFNVVYDSCINVRYDSRTRQRVASLARNIKY